ncbi:TonB-dependent siderophore receptor [Paracoccus aminophilus]|uniref:TonB-dependent siderophore receptor n=1 Tax=Paracoccus aminophilus JCM 7686 TaxID=1367847 RepID=S5Y5X6_PARAH|nr:TonB-dependent receptor [Paracoccus aminophilus]AGT11080.1 TonB-dependent siderophore receptor [Paracoccus aminophilus JCM 7686]
MTARLRPGLGLLLARFLGSTAMLTVAALPAAAQETRGGASSTASYEFNIPARPLSGALAQVGAVSGWRIAYGFSLPSGLKSQPVTGRMTPTEAVERMLRGSGISWRQSGDRAIVLIDARRGAAVGPAVDGAIQLDTVVISADATTDGSTSYAGSEASVAGKLAAPLKETPQSVSVMTKQRLNDQNITTVADAMRQATGVTAVNYGDGTYYMNARGFALDAQYDGMAVSSGIQYTSQFDLAIYDRVEVLRGPAGLQQGLGGAGGTANFVRLKPRDQFGISTETRFGSWNLKRQSVDVTGPINADGSLRGRFVGAVEDRDGFNGTGSRHGTLYGALEYDIAPSTTLSFSAAWQKEKLAPFDYGQSIMIGGGFLNAPRSTFFGADWSRSETEMHEIATGLRHDFGNGWVSNTNLSYRYTDGASKYAYMMNGIDPTTFESNYAIQRNEIQEKLLNLDTSLTGSVDVFGRPAEIVVGASMAEKNRDRAGGFMSGGRWNVFDAHHQIPNVDAPYTWANSARAREMGLYSQARIKVTDPLTVVVGGRLSWYEAKNRNRMPVGEWEQEPDINARFSGNVGLLYDITPSTTLYASYADIFTPQADKSTFEGVTLKPREGRQIEVGAKTSLLDDRLLATAAIFEIKDSNRPIDDPDHAWFYRPGGKARSRGFETEVTGEITDGWSLTAGYTYLDTKITDNENPAFIGQSLDTEEPRHSLKVWSKYQFQEGSQLEGLSLAAGLRAYSKTKRIDSIRTIYAEQGGYAVVDLQAGYRFNDKLDAALTVTNAFDRTYWDRLPTRFFGNYGEPRAVQLSIRSRW